MGTQGGVHRKKRPEVSMRSSQSGDRYSWSLGERELGRDGGWRRGQEAEQEVGNLLSRTRE